MALRAGNETVSKLVTTRMTTEHWAFLVLVTLNALLFVAKVGKPRKPITPGEAVWSLIEWGRIAWLALS